ncbi:glutamate racemase [Thioalkalicoccus limnaeus]|uniref:Glutamate racemase n=1 Tax=Thioalkalicoccus limnaeus TaxID=120681 RepID=A0ABV4B9K8_9GAMM
MNASYLNPANPIGVFDSGVGGLSVLREIRRELPHEDLIYVADSGFAPYGDRPSELVASRAMAIAGFLLDQPVKAIVIACNTATGVAARSLRDQFTLPIIAMEPAVKPAVACTRSGVVGVLATSQTLAGHGFRQLLERLGGGVRILAQPCPGLVERIEAGDLTGAGTRTLVDRYVSPLLAQGADTIVLGCTHYPHVTPLIEELAGPRALVLDSGAAVARQVKRRLAESGLLRVGPEVGAVRFWTSGEPRSTTRIMTRFWTSPIDVSPLPVRDG